MPVYLVISQSQGSSPAFDHVAADDLVAAALKVKDRYASGQSVDEHGFRPPILLGMVEFDAVGSITPNADPDLATSSYTPRAKLPAINDLAAGANVATTVTKVNAILATLRNARIIA